MIPRDLGEVSESNLKSLIRDDASENKRREFKALLNLDGKHKQKHKAHLVQEISGFANEEGGDFIVGVAEDDDGIAEKLIGMELDSVDNTKEQWGNILRDNIDPPIPSNLLDMKAVEFQNVNGNRRHGIIIRTEASWRAPHRETLTHRFYGRSPSGKQELDMGEIRDQFLETERFTERVKGFKDERVDAIRENSAAVPLVDGPLLALHVVPSNAFVRGTVLDPKSASRENDDSPRLMANRPSGSYARYNTDGYLMASTTRKGDVASKYVQTFRTGPIESVTNYGMVDKSNADGKESYINSSVVRQSLKPRLSEYVSFLDNQDARYPYSVFLSALFAEGFFVATGRENLLFQRGEVVERPDARFPEAMVESPSTDIEDVVSDLMDYLYQAAGHKGEPESLKESRDEK